MPQSLKTQTFQLQLDPDDYRTGALVTTVPDNAQPAAQVTVRYLMPPPDEVYVGNWMFCLREEDVGAPDDDNYSYRLDPGDPASEDLAPKGQVWAFATADANGPASVYVGYKD